MPKKKKDELEKEETQHISTALKNGGTIRLILKTTKGNAAFIGRVIEVTGKSFFLETPPRDETQFTYRKGDKAKVAYQGVDALYEFDTEIIGLHENESGGTQYEFQLPKVGYRIQRRNYFRVNLGLKAKIKTVKEEMISQSHFLTPYGTWKDCFITNISGGGVAFATDLLLGDQGYCEIEFELSLDEGPKKFQEILKIVRSQKVNDRDGYGGHEYAYGAYFFSMDDRIREDLVQFVFLHHTEISRKNN